MGCTSVVAAEESAAPAMMAPAEAAKAAADAAVTPVAGTPGAAAEPTPVVDPEKLAADCKKGLSALGGGDAKGLDALEKSQRDSLMMNAAAVNALTCLAIAENDEKFCDALAKDGRKACLEQRKLIGELKGIPKEQLKAELIYKQCVNDMPVADCETVRDAMTAKDAGKCKGFTKIDANFCVALAAGDASTCKKLTDEAMRDVCAAYAADEPKHCPEDSQDCRNLTSFMAAVTKKGLAGVADLDAGAAAAVDGRQSCTAVLAELEKACSAK